MQPMSALEEVHALHQMSVPIVVMHGVDLNAKYQSVMEN
jgi:hypothetical protein